MHACTHTQPALSVALPHSGTALLDAAGSAARSCCCGLLHCHTLPLCAQQHRKQMRPGRHPPRAGAPVLPGLALGCKHGRARACARVQARCQRSLTCAPQCVSHKCRGAARQALGEHQRAQGVGRPQPEQLQARATRQASGGDECCISRQHAQQQQQVGLGRQQRGSTARVQGIIPTRGRRGGCRAGGH